MGSTGPISKIKSCATASHALSRAEQHELGKVAEVGKRVLATAAQQLVLDADGTPMLRSTSFDGTPITTRLQIHRQRDNGKRICRSGHESHEFLIMLEFYRYVDHTGECHTRAVVRDPLSLKYGKTAPAIFSCVKWHMRTLRQLNHTGIAIEHYTMDRCGFSAFHKLLYQWHQTETSFDHDLSKLRELLDLLQWDVYTPCAGHRYIRKGPSITLPMFSKQGGIEGGKGKVYTVVINVVVG